MTDRKEYMRELMRKKRSANKTANTSANSDTSLVEKVDLVSTNSVSTKDDSVSNPVSTKVNWQDIPLSHFDGKGRGVPVNGYVLVSRGFKNTKEGLDLDQGVVTVEDWYSRLHYTCKHDRQGWSCPKCL